MRSPEPEGHLQRLLDLGCFDQARVHEQDQIHQVFHPGVVPILPGEGVGVDLFRELLRRRNHRDAHRRNPRKVQKRVSFYPSRLTQLWVAKTYIHVKLRKDPSSQSSLDSAADTTTWCSGQLTSRCTNQEPKGIAQIALGGNL